MKHRRLASDDAPPTYLRTYECDRCGGLHLTSQRRRGSAPMKTFVTSGGLSFTYAELEDSSHISTLYFPTIADLREFVSFADEVQTQRVRGPQLVHTAAIERET